MERWRGWWQDKNIINISRAFKCILYMLVLTQSTPTNNATYAEDRLEWKREEKTPRWFPLTCHWCCVGQLKRQGSHPGCSPQSVEPGVFLVRSPTRSPSSGKLTARVPTATILKIMRTYYLQLTKRTQGKIKEGILDMVRDVPSNKMNINTESYQKSITNILHLTALVM